MFPSHLYNLNPTELDALSSRVSGPFSAALHEMIASPHADSLLVELYLPLADFLCQRATAHGSTLLVGINGAQGAGKSTLCELLRIVLQYGFDKKAVVVSIDDLYLTRHERSELARDVHPLLQTRGVPGTHDVDMGLALFDHLQKLGNGEPLPCPRFDKARDDRAPRELWPTVTGPVDIVLFEGWCVGALPQPAADLATPVNSLEQDEDTSGAWRRYVNDRLADYAALFSRLDLLLMLKVPSMQSVFEWRSLQERKLAARASGQESNRIMNAEQIRRFIMHYERLTRWMLEEMPQRADLVMTLNADHCIESVAASGNASPEGGAR